MNKIITITTLGLIIAGTSGNLIPVVHAEEVPTPSATVAVTVTPTPTKREGIGAAVKAAGLAKAKDIGNKIFTDNFLSRLSKLRVKIVENKNIGSEARTVLLQKVDSEIAWFTSQKNLIDSATTVDQIKSIVRSARTRMEQVSKEIRKLYVSHWFVVRLETVITRLEKDTLPRIEKKLGELEAKNIDVTAEKAFLATAKSDVAAAKVKITDIRNSTSYDAAKQNFETAKTHLNNARKALKSLVESLKAKV